MRRLDNIDLRLLRVFVALVEAGGFADAQISLNLSQSTLSTHLAALERSLGGKLCERGRRGFALTSFGDATYSAAKRLFSDIDVFQQRVGGYGGQRVGRLRIGIVDGVVTSPHVNLQGVIRDFLAPGDNVFIDLHLGTPHDLEHAIATGHRDVVIGPFAQKAPGVTYVALHREPHALYCGYGHPLFDLDAREITQVEIERSLFSVRGYRQLEDLYRVDHPRANGNVIQIEAQVMLILSGRFIGFLPRHIGDPWVEKQQMRALRPENYQFRSLHLAAYRRTDEDNPLLRAFVRQLVNQTQQVEAA